MPAYRRNIDTLTDDEQHILAGHVAAFLTQKVIDDHRLVDHMHQFFAHHRAYIFGLETFIKQRLPKISPLREKFVPLPYWDSTKPLPAEFTALVPRANGSTAEVLVVPNAPDPFPALVLPPLPPVEVLPLVTEWQRAQSRAARAKYAEDYATWLSDMREEILLHPPITDRTYLHTSYSGKDFPDDSGLDNPGSFADPQDLATAHINGRGLGMDITEGIIHTQTHYHGITHAALGGIDQPWDVAALVLALLNPLTLPLVKLGPFLNGGNTAAPLIFWPLHAFFDTLCWEWELARLLPVTSPDTVASDKGPEFFLIGKDGIVWHICHLGGLPRDDGTLPGPNADHPSFGNWEHWHRIADERLRGPQPLRQISVVPAPGGGVDIVGIKEVDSAAVHIRLFPPDCEDQSAWDVLGGRNKQVAAIAAPSGRLYVFAIQSRGVVQYMERHRQGEQWKTWQPVLGRGHAYIEVIADGDRPRSRIHVFGLANGLVQHRWQGKSAATWSDPELVPADHRTRGGLRFTTFRVERNADDRLEVFAIGTDSALYHSFQIAARADSPFSPWLPLDPGPVSDLAVARNTDGRLEVFYVSNGRIHHRWQIAPNRDWADGRGTIALDAPVQQPRMLRTAPDREGRLMLFCVAGDGLVWHAWQQRPNDGPWLGWLLL